MTFPASGASSAADLPDYAPIPQSALGPALNDQGYYVGRVRAVDEIAAANGVSNPVTHLVYSHHHADHAGAGQRRPGTGPTDELVAAGTRSACCLSASRMPA